LCTGPIYGGTGNTTANIIAYANVSNGGAGSSQFLFGNNSGISRGYLSYSHASEAILFGTSGSEGMRLTSTGLGIGTSTAYSKLYLKQPGNGSGVAGFVIENSANDNRLAQYFDGSGDEWRITASYGSTGAFKPITFWTSDTKRLTLDSSGNLGLGGAPSAWQSIYRTLEIPSGAFFGRNDGGIETGIMANSYRDSAGTRKYRATGVAMRYEQSADGHTFFTAPSGTAGNAITFTQAMSLLSDGNLVIGRTSDSFSTVGMTLRANGAISATANGNEVIDLNRLTSDGGIQRFFRSGTQVGSISVTTSATTYNTSSDYRLKNITGPITNSGAYIDSLNPVEGTWKADGSTFVGLIAHQVQEASRTQVATGVKDGAEMQSMDYSNSELIANLIAEVKSLRQRVATLEAQ
jgi:hypothetical protein